MRHIIRAARTAAKTVLAGGIAVALTGSATLIGTVAAPAEAAQTCRPSAEHPYPVVLLHGTADDATAWNVLGPKLTDAGYCVFAPSYGKDSPLIPFGGIAAVRSSADEVAAYIDGVLAATGASRVDIVGHSQGGTIAEYYAKNLGRAANVHAALLLSPVSHGTTLGGVTELANQVPALRDAADRLVLPAICAACADLEVGSDLTRALNDGPIAQPGVRYAVLATRDDTISTPAGGASFLEEPGVRNEYVQDLRPGVVTHKDMPRNDTVIAWVSAQLAAN
ncbi:esterase/lipase family protein [Nocardia sp. NPDC056000]|uniref:esterase/lipase family protein n=1 Tax=Nocardia sp. NPDC056000 TaxID=3345674 RepID=UPI0035DFD54D